MFAVYQAYAWGFDIRNWQRHLNALTWPEIFRQLAFAAGFGPKLKKRGGTWATLGDKHEVGILLPKLSIEIGVPEFKMAILGD